MDFGYKYNPDEDPLIQRARSRGPGGHRWVWILVVLLVAWIGYREYRLRHGEKVLGVPTASSAAPTLVSEATFAQRPPDGPFRFSWQPGQKTVCGISVGIEGKGNPALTGSTGLSLGMEADFSVTVTGIENDGTAALQVDFLDANLHGNHFGFPVNLQRRGGAVRSFADDAAAPVPTFANTRLKRPDMSNLAEPIVFQLSPKGTLPNSGEDMGGPRLVMMVLQLSGMQFPSAGLVAGDAWEREQEFSWPGMKAKIPVVVRTTYVSEGVCWGRRCAYLLSEIRPGEAGRGKLAKIARVDTTGTVKAYFDLDLHRVLYNEAELTFDLILAGGLDAAADLFGTYSGMLEEIEGGKAFDLKAAATKTGPEEPIGFRVRSTMSFKG